MNISKNFTLRELTKSETASRYGIDNKPNPEFTVNLQKLCETVLQPIRDEYKKPIVVSSGYRCPLLNKIVGGKPGSCHVTGSAIDIQSVKDTKEENKKLFDLIVDMIKSNKIVVRTLIDERNYSWLHIDINDKYHSYRKNYIIHQ